MREPTYCSTPTGVCSTYADYLPGLEHWKNQSLTGSLQPIVLSWLTPRKHNRKLSTALLTQPWPLNRSLALRKLHVAMFQKPPREAYAPPNISIDGHLLKVADHFTYLGNVISNDTSTAKDVDNRITKASTNKSTNGLSHVCPHCSRPCKFTIGLHS